jgi:2-polyprenyl-3-methyl-5-hydroxy-6-metoxy-1,4-benzoquinol methylase
MSAESAEPVKTKPYDPEKYWADRYQEIDITKSGHVDLPEVYNAWLYRRKKERLMQGLLKAGFDPKGASVLEIATGTGIYVEMWKRLGVKKLAGIDISENATNALKQRFPEYSFHKRDLSQPGLVGTTGTGYDLVTAVDMLYHIVKDEDFPVALGNLAESCRPGGYFAIHDFFMHHREMDFGYIKLRTLAAYRAALDAAGFEIVSRTPTFFLTVQTYDYRSLDTKKRMDKVWARLIHPFISRRPELAGRLGYYSDRLLGSLLSEGPSFEMMICRRKQG